MLATARSESAAAVAQRAGAHEVVRVDQEERGSVAAKWGGRPHHVVEVDLAANIELDEQLLPVGGTIATYASSQPVTAIPFWLLVFKNISLHFVGSDDFPAAAKDAAALEINAALEDGWPGFAIAHRLPLDAIADAYELVEQGRLAGRVVLDLR